MSPDYSRRELLKQSTLGTLAALAPAVNVPAHSSFQEAGVPVQLRPRAIDVSGFHAYPDRHSLRAGERLQLHVSSTIPYRLQICRLGPAIDDRSQDEVCHRFPDRPAVAQPIHPGSCVVIERGLPADFLQSEFAVELWLRPFLTAESQTILSQDSTLGPFGLSLTATKEVQVRLGAEFLLQTPALPTLKWSHVVLNCTAAHLEIWLDSQRLKTVDWQPEARLQEVPLVFGAAATDSELEQLLDADLAMPVVYRRALSPTEVATRFGDKGLHPPEFANDQLYGCWLLDEEQGDIVKDWSSQQRTGRILNQGTWMIGGPSFDGKNVVRYGDRYDPAKDSLRGHALRLASDDLYDCGWALTHEFVIPTGSRPGLYCARADFEHAGQPQVCFVTFLVRKPADAEQASLLVLCSSNTWTAYNSTPFMKNLEANQKWFASTAGGVNVDPRAPAYSCYLNHRGGQPAYQFGLRMPWPVAGPDVWYSGPEMGYSHLMRGERFTHVWLDENGFDYDLILDLDLHRDPELLDGYKSVLLNGHSEYWSSESYRGLDSYLRQGGTAIVFSGNTMFWRVSFNAACTIMECRKLDNRIGGMTHASVGELYHSQDSKRGSLMRECGMAAWQNLGLECDGWGGITPPEFGVYHTEAADHFLFHGPEPVGLKPGETFGHAPDGGVPKAIGHEWDVRLSRLKSYTKNVPADFTWPEEPGGMVTLARGVRAQTHVLDYFTEPVTAPDGTVAEMIYWERPQGGKVFHGGAIAVGWALSADPKLQKLVRNVLHHFEVPRRAPS